MAEAIRFYCDEHVPRVVSEGLRRRGIDVETVQEAGLRGASDTAHLAHARQTGRVIITQDTDFLRLHAAGESHPGIVYAPQHIPVGAFIRGLLLIYELLAPEQMVNHVEFL